MRQLTLRTGVSLLLCAAALGGGCGDDSGGGGEGAAYEELGVAIDKSLSEETVTNEVMFDISAGAETISFGGTQITEVETGAAEGELVFSGFPGIPEGSEALLYSDGENTYARYDFLAGGQWVVLPPNPLSSLSDVSGLREIYELALSDVESSEGLTELGIDEPVTRYTATYNLEAVLESLPAEGREAASEILEQSDGTSVELELFVSEEDGFLRRFEVDLGPLLPGEGSKALATIDFVAYGEPLGEVNPPDPEDVVTLNEAAQAAP